MYRGRGQERAGVMAETEWPAEHMCKYLSSQKRHHTLNSAHSSFLKNKTKKIKTLQHPEGSRLCLYHEDPGQFVSI